MPCFTFVGVAAFSCKRGWTEDIPGNVSSTQSFSPFLKNDFHTIQSSLVPASKHFTNLIYSSCDGCLTISGVTVHSVIYLLFTGHSLTTFVSSVGTIVWLSGNSLWTFSSNITSKWLRCTLSRFFRNPQHTQYCTIEGFFRCIRFAVNVDVVYGTILCCLWYGTIGIPNHNWVGQATLSFLYWVHVARNNPFCL